MAGIFAAAASSLAESRNITTYHLHTVCALRENLPIAAAPRAPALSLAQLRMALLRCRLMTPMRTST